MVGDVSVGGDSPISVQSMTNTLTTDIKATVNQIKSLENVGADLVRVSCPDEESSLALKKIVKEVNIPIIAAGGFVDGRTMAAAFSLGAQGIQMGTRMVSSKESPVHSNWKQAILSADDQSTVLLNRFSSPALRALRTEKTNSLEKNDDINAMQEFGTALDLYFGGDMEASIALTGQVAGRIDKEKSVKDIINETMDEFYSTIESFNNLS